MESEGGVKRKAKNGDGVLSMGRKFSWQCGRWSVHEYYSRQWRKISLMQPLRSRMILSQCLAVYGLGDESCNARSLTRWSFFHYLNDLNDNTSIQKSIKVNFLTIRVLWLLHI